MKHAVFASSVTLVMLACAGTAISACRARIVDVGANDASSAGPTSSTLDGGLARSQYGCADVIDEDLASLRQGACGGQCSSTPAGPYGLESKQATIAAMAGQWLTCEGTFGPADSVGVEFAPGCRVFFLRKDEDGAVVRGTEARFQATYDIYDPRSEGTPRRIDVHIDDQTTLTFDVVAHRCPEHLQLSSPIDARVRIELAPDFGDAGRPNPVACIFRPRATFL
ncbi:MAG: hypothetical protein JWP87_3927 [Labilithrix sp.]|nr:hypothetical protein [Labilithrix sp.]